LLALTGEGLTQTLAQQLGDSGWIEPGDGSRERRLKLTPLGRQLAIEIFAVAKAAEGAATRLLDFEELSLLKQLLKQVIRGTLAGGTGSVSSPQ
jgi:3-hydroxy-9,10-secoandrosta-1,3,5(10)-triene-9,17-dione monooxygenase reductase component